MASIADSSNSLSFSPDDQRLLNTYIYDYLVKQSYGESALAFRKEVDIPTISDKELKRRQESSDAADGTLTTALPSSPTQKASTTEKPNGTEKPEPGASSESSPKLEHIDIPIDIDGSFLAEWWAIFWDMFAARQGRPSSSQAACFIAHNQVIYPANYWSIHKC